DLNNNYGGPLPNDVGGCTDPIYGGPGPGSDCDGGANKQQNNHDILGVTQSGGSTTVAFTLHSTPNRAFHVEIFDNLAMPSLPAGREIRAAPLLMTRPNG